MAEGRLVRSRNDIGILTAVTGIIGSILANQGQRLSNEAQQALIDATTSGLEQGGSAFRRYIAEWRDHFRNELGNEANQIATLTRTAINEARRQGGELYDALHQYTLGPDVIMESTPSLTGEGQHTRFIEPSDIQAGTSLLLLRHDRHIRISN